MHSIAIIGKGIVGLTTAIELVNKGYHVDIFFNQDSHVDCSHKAGAYWWPHKCYPPEKVLHWSKVTLARYFELLNQHVGVKMIEHYRLCEIEDEADFVLGLVDEWVNLDRRFEGKIYEKVYKLQVPYVNTHKLLAHLQDSLMSRNVTFINQKLNSIEELPNTYDLIINCSGLGAAQLCQDENLYPARGLLVSLKNNIGLKDSYRVVTTGNMFTLVLPRDEDILLGGTVENGIIDDKWYQVDVDKIIQKAIEIVPDLKKCPVNNVSVGFRPNRDSIRLEADQTYSTPVIHNYGHGGGGYTVAFGCAEACAAIACNYLDERKA